MFYFISILENLVGALVQSIAFSYGGCLKKVEMVSTKHLNGCNCLSYPQCKVGIDSFLFLLGRYPFPPHNLLKESKSHM